MMLVPPWGPPKGFKMAYFFHRCFDSFFRLVLHTFQPPTSLRFGTQNPKKSERIFEAFLGPRLGAFLEPPGPTFLATFPDPSQP